MHVVVLTTAMLLQEDKWNKCKNQPDFMLNHEFKSPQGRRSHSGPNKLLHAEPDVGNSH